MLKMETADMEKRNLHDSKRGDWTLGDRGEHNVKYMNI
jgi:hypothetical protein